MTVTEKAQKPQPETVTLTKEEHQKLLDQIKELEGMRERFLRGAADYENAKKRLTKEREEFVRFSQERLLRDLLPILDNLERALEHSESSDASVTAGIQLIGKQLLDLLHRHGLKRLQAEGERFDPHLHEAVGEVEEEGAPGMVVREIAGGYLLHDRVLRPAKVQIRKDKAPQEEKEDEIT